MATNYLQTSTGSISWATASNWSGLAVPVNSDATTIGQGAATIDTGYNQGAVTLASLTVPLTFIGTCGLATQTPIGISSITRSSSTATLTTASAHGLTTGDAVLITGVTESDYNGLYTVTVTGATTYTYTVANTPTSPATVTGAYQKRYEYLAIGATLFRYGDPGNGTTTGAGSGRFKFDGRAIATTITCVGTKSNGSTDSGLEPFRFLGTSITAYNHLSGLAGCCTTTPSEVSTITTTNVNSGTVNYGAGVTWTTAYLNDGTLNTLSGGTTYTQAGGVGNVGGAGVITNLTTAATTRLNIRKASAGDTITGTLQLMNGAVLDLTGNPAAISVGTLRITGKDIVIRRNKANPGALSWTTLTQDDGSTFRFE